MSLCWVTGVRVCVCVGVGLCVWRDRVPGVGGLRKDEVTPGDVVSLVDVLSVVWLTSGWWRNVNIDFSCMYSPRTKTPNLRLEF